MVENEKELKRRDERLAALKKHYKAPTPDELLHDIFGVPKGL
jgi:hypothetical protein